MEGKWVEIKVITKSLAVEPVSGIFYGLGVKGLAIEDPEDLSLNQRNPLSWDYAEKDIFKYGSMAVVKGYFSQDDNISEIEEHIKEKLEDLKEYGIDAGDYIVAVNYVYERDWANEWKKYYKTLKIGKRIVINPLWEKYTPEKDEVVINIDPGMAFGTGTHETTMMCLGLLEKYVKKDCTVLDIGTGSGILSIASSKLGAKRVTGVDLDEIAVESACENVAVNNINNVEIKYGNLVDVVSDKADLIVANIIADVIIELSKKVKDFLKEDGIFIASGIIRDRKEDVLDEMKRNNLNPFEVLEMGEWVAIASKIGE